MDIVRMFDRRVAYFVAAIALLLSFALPTLVGAEQVTERSIQLSSSSKAATNVTYTLEFTTVNAADSIIVDFCTNSPLIGATCTAPTGFDVAAATTATSGFTASDLAANTLKLDKSTSIAAASTPNVVVSGIVNPSSAGTVYARILTYTTANVSGYVDADTLGTYEDEGSVALSITETIGVSGAVLESMVFCVSKAAPGADCSGTNAPVLELGENTGGVIALSASAVSTGDLYTQISTNAASGAVVRLKSNATDCGGLLRAGAPTACDIAPALSADFSANEAKFGVKVDAAADTGTNPNGAFQAAAGSPYNASTYALRYAAGNATGVTSTYGDNFLDTNNAPANNKNMKLTFGASISNNTPAGLYSADLGLIATGKF